MLRICRDFKQFNTEKLLNVYHEMLLNTSQQEDISVFQAESEFISYVAEVFYSQENAVYAIWEHRDVYVSALRLEPYLDGVLLSALETAPEYRHMGFAATLIKCVLKEFQHSKVYTHIHRNNVISQELHRKCGFVEILDHGVLLDGTISRNYLTYSVSN